MTFFSSSPFIFPGASLLASAPGCHPLLLFLITPMGETSIHACRAQRSGCSGLLQLLLAQHPSSSSFWKEHFNFPVRGSFSLTSNPYRVGSADSNSGSKGRYKTWAGPISTFTPMDPEVVKDDTSCKDSHGRPMTFTLGVLLDVLRSQHSFCWCC